MKHIEDESVKIRQKFDQRNCIIYQPSSSWIINERTLMFFREALIDVER